MAINQLGAPSGGVLTNPDLAIIQANFSTINTAIGPSSGAPTGTGGVVLATSPAIVTPDLGTPSAINLANASGNALLSAGISAQVIQFVSVPLTLAQILATNSAPPTLIAAQGAGTLIDVVSMTVDLIRGSANYAGGGAVAGYLGTDSTGVLATATIAATFFTTFAASQIIKVAGALAVAASSTVLNKALVLANPTADFTSGTGGTAIVKISYRVFSGLS